MFLLRLIRTVRVEADSLHRQTASLNTLIRRRNRIYIFSRPKNMRSQAHRSGYTVRLMADRRVIRDLSQRTSAMPLDVTVSPKNVTATLHYLVRGAEKPVRYATTTRGRDCINGIDDPREVRIEERAGAKAEFTLDRNGSRWCGPRRR